MADDPFSGPGLTIFLRGLRLDAEIGLYPHERGRSQPLVIDVAMKLSPADPVTTIGQTVNYELLASAARTLAAEGHVDLVETFAERLAAACLAQPRSVAVRVRIDKPEAIAGADAAGVEVTLTAGNRPGRTEV